MLNSLLIKNYRLFKELQIDSLKRVNLIIGKNNVGKSSLLEALNLYFNKDTFIYQLFSNLNARGEWDFDDMDSHRIQGHLNSLLNEQKSDNERIYVGTKQNGFNFYWDSETESKRTFIKLHHIQMKSPQQPVFLSNFNKFLSSPPPTSFHRLLYSGTSKIKLEQLAFIWSDIALTEQEEYVISALKIIDEQIERLTFVDKPRGGRQAIVKRKGAARPVSLGSMGDGIYHILKIILTLVKCENGSLLIDEFETGLHWSVQAELWKIIFSLSHRLNIQIFATTHSRDTLWALQQVAISEGLKEETRIIKLKSLPKKQTIKAVELEVDQVKDLLEQGLEIR